LLEGLEINITTFSKLRDLILGSDFNSRKKIDALKKLSSKNNVTSYFSLHSDTVNGISNVLSYDLTHSLGNLLQDIKISEHISGTRKIAQAGDFIISRLRSYLKEFAVIQANKNKQVFSTEYLVYRPLSNKITSNTLMVYCLTKHVQTILNHSQYGSAHPRFFEFVFNELPIPDILLSINGEINELIMKAFQFIQISNEIYFKAEKLLLKYTGVDLFFPTQISNIKSFKESFLKTGRLDAEFYQAKYDTLEKNIKSQKFTLIKDIASENYRGLQPIYVENGDLDVINSKHILEKGLDYKNFEKTSFDYWERQKKARVLKGDILVYTTGANIGRTQVYRIDKPAIASNHVNILRIKEENPFYIGFVLNSLIGRMQTEKFSAGSAQAELYPKDLNEFFIPIIEQKQQTQIIDLVEESFRLKQESQNLLETAKKAVEMAIEQNEESAIKFIEQSLNNLNN
jgi:restriction endonuclease S subunit